MQYKLISQKDRSNVTMFTNLDELVKILAYEPKTALMNIEILALANGHDIENSIIEIQVIK